MCVHRWAFCLGLVLLISSSARAGDSNRLTYLDENDPYYVSRTFPRLITPQWVGEEGVEAVVVLAIDDMREPEKYEKFLRPVLQRLKRIDGRAGLSIMTNQVNPRDGRLQAWLKEGLSLETHTIDHPCPFFKDGDFAKARSTYERCVDLMSEVPNSHPVAFRMPCCDSLNTPSPRFYAEIFNRTTAKGNFLTLDSSVFNVLTSNDPELPRALVVDEDGQDRFRKYLPKDRTFVNTIENYPYPYVLGRLCWQFPCVMPSDWVAQHRQQPNNPVTVRDWKAALDATVLKRGVFCMVFHPHGWIRNEQVVDFIDYADTKYGKRVKFLSFHEAQERLDKHLLGGQTLRASDGSDNGVRLLDLDNDGYLDVVIGNDKLKQTRRWSPQTKTWSTSDFPLSLVNAGAHFGVVRADGNVSMLVRNEAVAGAWHFADGKWIEDKLLLDGLVLKGREILTCENGRDRGVRLRDLDGDGRCELIVSNDTQQAIFRWSEKEWSKLPFALPEGVAIVNSDGKDNGLRFVDIDEDGHDDVLFSNGERYSLHLLTSMKDGWSRRVLSGKHGDEGELPAIAKNGTNNGAWFHSRQVWWGNERTPSKPDHVDRRSFNELLANVTPEAKSPQASLRSIRTRPGFQVELVTSEPLVQSPIAFAWGPDGKFWVVEMGDYPLGLENKGKPGGRIKYLEDTDGDGRFDKATVFLDGLSFPTSVLPWRKGVLVTCAPEIFYAEDTKGTGKADLRVPLFTGFVPGNPQHRVNSLIWGLDNWIYCANGDSGGRIRSVKTGASIDSSGRDLRIRPDDGRLDAQAGLTQYGRCRNDWGDWFGCNNSNPMFQYVLADHYIRRNPHLAAPDSRVSVSVTPGASAVFPVSRTLPRFNDPEAFNHFTSACSVIVYRDELFGRAFLASTFVSEPVHNLIHREIITPKGVLFTSRRASDEQDSEFLASSDNWFRPTTIQTGPDGALWVADMYRAVIEHPEWIPADWQRRIDLRAGADKGRIYRVYPVGAKPRKIPRLDRLDTSGLVAALDSPNGWQRDTAQQMLLWRKDGAAVPFLEKMTSDCQRPLGRLHALCTLDGLNALTPALLRHALADAHPGVRRHAVRLCEGWLAKAPEVGEALLKRVHDDDPHVRMQLAYTLGGWDDARAGEALGQLALRDAGDRYMTAAVMSSVNRKNLDRVLLAVMKGREKAPPAPLLDSLLRLANALGDTEALAKLLKTVGTPEKGQYAPWQFTTMASLLDALDERNTPLSQLRNERNEDLQAALKQLSELFATARAALARDAAAQDEKLRAIRLLGRGLDHQQEDTAALAELLVPQTAVELQNAAIAALGRLRSPRVPELLLHGWKAFAPAQRRQVLGVLLSRDKWLTAVLEAMENKSVAPSEIDAVLRQRLLNHRAAEIRRRATKLFADAINPDRQKVIDAYQSVLGMSGDAKRGAEVFRKTCAVCHQLGGVGNAVGPDLASLGDKSPPALLIAILDPNRAVEDRYVGYTAVTKGGRTFSGVLAAETGNSITLIDAEGKKNVILRSDLDELTSSGKSAMPEGLEKEIKPQDMADLIAHVRSQGPQPKRKEFEGNKPALVRSSADGSLLLPASNCEIYGPTVVLEKQYGNLGYWSSADDHAVWTVEVARPGRYAVWLDWACAPDVAGKRFLLQAGVNQMTGRVDSTGSWDTYRQAKVGEIVLASGPQRVTFRSAGRIFHPLIDLKSVKLVPVKE
ncbi:MAG TPA: PVC-type heme-binding CxxCH protein [Gemmataceae bacterium]|nr:PVC-type heme-binding CxxCH protein [Gemmataceae bacterium]